MGEKRISPRIVFLLVLLVAVGVFLLYSRLSFTGYVTSVYFSGSEFLNDFADNDSIFENTKFDGTSAVVLDNLTLVNGNYTSPMFAAPNNTEVFWTALPEDFDISLNPSISSVSYYYRACNENIDCAVEFVPVSSSVLLRGKYFQYKVEMRTSGTSPKLYGVAVDYQTPLDLPITINSPANTTYNNESIPIRVSANDTSVWFFNGTGNETYTAEVVRVYPEGSYTITAWVGDAFGNVNSTSVTFNVAFLRTYYRLANNVCSAVSLTVAQKTANDYDTVAACQSQVTNTTTTTEEEEESSLSEIEEECVPDWQPSEWSACVDGVQTRTCVDANACETTEICPTEQACTVEAAPVTTAATETPAEEATTSRGFLSVVGSAIATPFTYVFGNRTRIMIFSGVLLVIIAVFFTFKFSVPLRLKVLKFLNIRRRKAE